MYKHTAPNGKVYIGITSQQPERRWQNGYGYRDNEYFMRAIAKYGWDSITHEILFDGLTQYEAERKERELIQHYDSANREYGYNHAVGGGVNKTHTPETIRRMREAAIKNRNADRLHTPEVVQKRSKSQKGHVVTDSTRKKIGDSHRGVKSVSARKVIQITLDGTIVRVWPCIMDIERECGYANTAISRCCRGGRPTAYGYVWRYADSA